MTLPPYQTACGATDIMAHVLERYFTNEDGVDLTDRLCEAVLSAVVQATPIVMKDPYNYDARAQIMWAGTLAHNHSVGLGREGDWASHQIEHELSAEFDVAHGAGLAVVFPAWAKYMYKHALPRFCQYATRVWGVEMDYEHPERTALAGIRMTEEYFASIGMPTRLGHLDIDDSKFEEMAVKCTFFGKRTLPDYITLDKEEIIDIFKLMV